jgi:hypothetical protein
LKAKARRDCWNEEFILISSEMDWTVQFYRYQAKKWERHADIMRANPEIADHVLPSAGLNGSNEIETAGKVCYAMKWKRVWEILAEQATRRCLDVKWKVGLVV